MRHHLHYGISRCLALMAIVLLPVFTGAQSLHVFMHNCTFLSTNTDTAYVETYLAVPGFELNYAKQPNGKFQGMLEVTLQYLRDSATAAFDKYYLRTPLIDDTTNINFNVLDLKRFSLPDGNYTVQLTVTDANRPGHAAAASEDLTIAFDRSGISMSDIELVQNFNATTAQNHYSKNGYDIHPMAISFLPESVNRIGFYTEIYHANAATKDDQIIILYSIKEARSARVAANLFRFTKQKPDNANVLFSQFDISDLPTGNYYLNVQVKDKNNKILTEQSAPFQRMNKNGVYELSSISLIDISHQFVASIPNDSMDYYLSSLDPIAESFEKDYLRVLIKSDDTLLKKQFLFNFWQRRNPQAPQHDWAYYERVVKMVNYNYSTSIDYGFETDRGRVYLQYGPPNQIEARDHESDAYPYEIWHYYKLKNQSNVRFVFCNSDLVSNDYKLIHSDAIGELSDSRWRFKIYDTFKESNGYNNLDQESFPDSYGSQVNDLWDR